MPPCSVGNGPGAMALPLPRLLEGVAGSDAHITDLPL